jgi:hypothetical protein
MRVSIDIDSGSDAGGRGGEPAAADAPASGDAVDGGSPSAQLLAAIAAAGGSEAQPGGALPQGTDALNDSQDGGAAPA